MNPQAVTRSNLHLSEPEVAGFDGERLQKVRNVLERAVACGAVPGTVALIARRGRVVFWEAFGQRMLVPERRPMERTTIFDLASVTKAVATATAVLLLMEDGELALEDPVERYIPAYSGGYKSATTLGDLLTHTSGLPLLPELHHDFGTADALWQAIYTMALLTPPRQRYLYTCLGYHLLGAVVETVVQQNLNQFLRERVFQPLGMFDTGFRPGPELQARCAATEFCKWRGAVICGAVHDENCTVLGGVSGNAGLFSTAWDLAIYCTALLGVEPGDEGVLFSPFTKRVMFQNHTPFADIAWGLGWGLRLPQFGDLLRMFAVGHTGWTGTSVCLVPEFGLTTILLTNRVHPSRDDNRIDQIRMVFHNAVAGALRME